MKPKHTPPEIKGYVTLHKHLSALIKYERRQNELHFEGLRTALSLARSELDNRLEGFNRAKEKLDKVEGNFVTKEVFNNEMKAHARLIYIGLGIVLAIAALLRFVGK